MAIKYGCKFVETSVAINDKVDDLLAGILKQIRLTESLERDLEALAAASNEQETSFVVERNNKKHMRNYSDAHLHDLVRNNNASNNSKSNPKPICERTGGGFLSFKSNTLSRKFFKSSKNQREFSQSMAASSPINAPTGAYTTDSIDTRANGGRSKSSSAGNSGNTISFFHKIYHSIFRKKSSNTHLQSVENLFSLPHTLAAVDRKRVK